ncbi:MAG: GNAT family N-acetyltransferase [Caulobacteraceae bacterium]
MTTAPWTEERLDALVEAFLAHTLPAAGWTHEAHLLVGMSLARRLPPSEVLPTLREAISSYNAATGAQNTDHAGYHESITAFYAEVLGAFARATAGLPAAEAARRLTASPLADRKAIERAYAPETLRTVAARRSRLPWDRPDFDPEALVAEALAPTFSVRLAADADITVLRALMHEAIGELQKPFLTPGQIEASREVMGLDSQLVADGTYFVVEHQGLAVGCGGWSRRATLFGGDHSAGRDAALLDPAAEPARVRAMYTRPGWERRGIGRAILEACESAAAAEGFAACELAATLAGEPLYRACGYREIEPFEVTTSGGLAIPLLRMGKALKA